MEQNENLSHGAPSGRILVVEEQTEIEAFLVETLGWQYRVTRASSEQEGLEKAIADRPDLIVWESRLPPLACEQFFHKLRSQDELNEVLIIVVTDKANDALLGRLLRQGADDCLARPFAVTHLLDRVEGLLVNRRRTLAHVRHIDQERYCTLLNSIDEGFCIIKMIFDEAGAPVDYQFLEVNRAFEQQTGLLAAQGKRMKKLVPGHESHWFELYGNIALTGKPARFEQRAEQLHRWYDVYAFPYGAPGNQEVAILFRDITQRKASEDQARETRAQLAMAMRVGRLGAWTLEVGDQSVNWSREARAIHQLGDDFKLTIDTAASLIDPSSIAQVELAVQSCIHQGLAFDIEVRAFTQQRERVWVRLIGEAMRDETGKIQRIQGAMQNITEIKQATIRANDLGERLKATLESMSDAFFTVDREWRFTYVNAEAERLLRRSRSELLGKIIWQEYPDSAETRFRKEYERALTEFVTVEFETFSGALNAWLRVSAHPSAIGLAVYWQDITATKMVRDALADSEEQYRMLFESSMDAILQTRPDGGVVRANAAACTMFAMTESAICRLARAGLVAPEDPRLETYVEERRRTGRASGELTLVRADGSRFEAEVASAEYCASDGNIRTYVVIRDITERLKARQSILALNSELTDRVRQRTAQLEQANAELKDFAHSLAHDLRSPIAAIKGFTEMLERSLPLLLPERSLHYLDRIRSAAQRMDAYTEGLLSLANVSQAPMAPAIVDLSAMAGEILAQLQEREPGRVVHMHVQRGLRVLGDAALLRMALDNLLGNAWKFTGRREVAEITFTALLNTDGEMVYRIKDNGAGFEMAHVGKLFGSFQRLHSQSEFPGNGIGLANVQRIVARHGGRIWAESVEGAGATFQFTLGAA